MSETISAPALVYCNCTKQKTQNNADETNFEIYRYLTVDPEGDRNIFCRDHPFLFSDDSKPYINITKSFPYCRAENYGIAVKSLEEYAKNKSMESIKQNSSESEIFMWGEAEATFGRAYEDFISKKQMNEKQYPCILQVVDRWFNTSKETINQYFTWSQETKKNLDKIQESFSQVVIKAKRELKKAQPSTWERLAKSFSELGLKFEDLSLNNGSLVINYKGFQRFDKAWNNKQSLSWFDDSMKEMREILESYSRLVCDELFFADNQEYVNSGLGTVRDLFLEFYEVMVELDYEDDQEFNDTLDEFKKNLEALVPDDKFVDKGKTFLTNNSFLVCRCGGIINIIYDGQALSMSFNKVESNLISLLKWIEKDLHKTIYETELWACWQMGVSFIDGFNFVRYVLLTIGQTSHYDNYIKAVYDGKEQNGFGVEMNIAIQSRSVLNKKDHNKSAVLNLVGATLGVLSFKLGAAFSITAATGMVLVAPNADNAGSAGAAVIAGSSDKAISTLGNLGGVFYIIKGFAAGLADISYETSADYVGEIKVAMKVGTHDITYVRSYDITGTVTGGETNKNVSMRMKPFYRLDASRSAYVSGMELDIRKYGNTIKVNTTIAVDPDKIEKLEKEYVTSDQGISEK